MVDAGLTDQKAQPRHRPPSLNSLQSRNTFASTEEEHLPEIKNIYTTTILSGHWKMNREHTSSIFVELLLTDIWRLDRL